MGCRSAQRHPLDSFKAVNSCTAGRQSSKKSSNVKFGPVAMTTILLCPSTLVMKSKEERAGGAGEGQRFET